MLDARFNRSRLGRRSNNHGGRLPQLRQRLPRYRDVRDAIAFQRDAPKILEIGFGMGETTAKIAMARPEDEFLAIEVHEPGVGALLKLIGEQGISNLRLMRHDAVEVVENMIPEGFLDGVHVYFPDPWHKKRHNKRRLIQPEFVALLSSRIKSGGYWHLATDWQEYAEQMMEVLSAESTLTNTGTLPGGYAERPSYRPVTKFEKKQDAPRPFNTCLNSTKLERALKFDFCDVDNGLSFILNKSINGKNSIGRVSDDTYTKAEWNNSCNQSRTGTNGN